MGSNPSTLISSEYIKDDTIKIEHLKKLMIKRVLYRATLSLDYSNKKCIDDIVKLARINNEKYNITGCLTILNDKWLTSRRNIYVEQIIEGNEMYIDRLYNNIKKDPRIENINLESFSYASSREYPNWSMKFIIYTDCYDNVNVSINDFIKIALLQNVDNKNIFIGRDKFTDTKYVIKEYTNNAFKGSEYSMLTYIHKDRKNKSFIHVPDIINEVERVNLVYKLYEMDLFTFINSLYSSNVEDIYKYKENALKQLVYMLFELKECNIVHRDIKTENILLDNKGHLYLTDFELANIIDDNYINRTHKIRGTISYLAPEVINGRRYSFKSDIWALGIVIYELYTGYMPWDILNYDNARHMSILYDTITKEPFKPNETLPPLVFDLLKHILTDYNRRYTIDDIMKHEMFKDTDWNSVYDDFEIESKVKNILINEGNTNIYNNVNYEELIKVSSPQIKEQRTAFWSNS